MDVRALDSETFLLFPGYLAPEPVCWSWARPGAESVFHARVPGSGLWLNDVLHENLTFANAPYDLAVAGSKHPELISSIFRAYDEGRIHDVQIREKLLDLTAGRFRYEEDEDGNISYREYSLAAIAKRRLNQAMDKDTWRLKYHDLYDIDVDDWPEGPRNYAVSDSVSTLKIHEQQEALVKYLGNETAQVQAHWALHLMSCWGFKTDLKAVEALEERVRTELVDLRSKLQDVKLVREDGSRDTKAAVRRMIEVVGEDVTFTKAGLDILYEHPDARALLQRAHDEGKFVSVAEDPCSTSADDILIAYARYTKLRNLLTGSIKDLKGGMWTPIQSRFEPLMETGRTSSSGPNIQNLRREPGVRECYVARPGCLLVACDFSQMELHTLAQCCFDYFGRSRLGEALNKGMDVHLKLAASLLGISYEQAVEHKNEPEVEWARQVSKPGNFGFPGGMSAKRYVGYCHSQKVQLDIHDAARIRAFWFQEWDEMALYFKMVSECIDDRGWHYVKQNRVERIRARCTFTSACNSHFQGLAADAAKAALYAVTREQFCNQRSPLFDTRCVAFVHDEIIAEVPIFKAHEASMAMKEIMEREANKFLPDYPTNVKPTLMKYWSKAAKPVYSASGRLIPWQRSA